MVVGWGHTPPDFKITELDMTEPTAVPEVEEDAQTRITIDTESYENGVSGAGSKTKHNGDPVAIALNGLTIEESAVIAGTLMGVPADEMQAKYAHLNVGQQRMNLGNRIRGAVAKLNKAKDAVEGAGEAALSAASKVPQANAAKRAESAKKAAEAKKKLAEDTATAKAAEKAAKAEAAAKAKAKADKAAEKAEKVA
jgi:hypothetical protein